MKLARQSGECFRLIALFAMFILSFSVQAGSKVFDLVSIGNDGSLPVAHYNGSQTEITPDGRFVVFVSDEAQLVSPNTKGYQIFLRDRVNKTTELISVNDQGQYGDGSSESPAISNDGCRVVYRSGSTNLVANDTNGSYDVFVRDRCVSPMTTSRVNLNYNGAQSQEGYIPAISGNGRYVAFQSYGDDYVLGQTTRDALYLRDLDAQTTKLITLSQVNGGAVTGAYPSISDDGSRIVFVSASEKLINQTLPASWNVFLYDANANPPIKLVSADVNGTPQDFANGDWPHPDISADGHFVSFYSNARNLVADDTNDKSDIFVKNVDSGEVWRVTVSSSGQQSTDTTNLRFNSSLSQDGTWVTFYTEATNLASDNLTLGRVVLMHNLHTGVTFAVPQAPNMNPESAPNISSDKYGRFISNFWGEKLDASLPSAGVFVYDRHRLPIAAAKIDASTALPINQGNTVTLDGSGSNNAINADFFASQPTSAPPLTFTWSQLEGPATVSFNDIHARKPNFSVPATGTYKFQLIVNDSVEDSAPAIVTVQVGSTQVVPNVKPIANAGADQTATAGSIVYLDGSTSSDPDNGPGTLTYSWTQISGQSLTLNNANTATPSFTPMLDGVYSFQLVVRDGKDVSLPSVVTVTVGTATQANIPPVAVAGDDQSLLINDLVSLDGSQSYDPDGNSITYKWTQISGSKVTLSDVTDVSPSFSTSKIGSYSFRLVVNDGQADSLPSTVTITIGSGGTAGNELPVAVPEPTFGLPQVGTPIKLTGIRSYDPDFNPGKKLKYQWVQNDGPATVKLLAPTSATPKFTPNLPGDYVFDLAVNDGLDWGVPVSLAVHVDGDIQVTAPAAGDSWFRGIKQTIEYQTSGINPKVSMKAYLIWLDANGDITGVKLPGKPKAKPYGTLTVKIPNNPAYILDAAIVVLCANDDFCGLSEVFSIQ